MRLELVTAPAAEPVTLAEAKAHLRVSAASEDALITRLIGAARRHVEAVTRRRLITQTWRLYLDRFDSAWSSVVPQWVSDCRGIVLPDLAPVQSIASVKYIDTAGALQTLAAGVYQLVPEAPARLFVAYGQSWPDIRGDKEGVRIEAVCGYGAAGAAVPEDIVAALLLHLSHLYEHRDAVTDYPTAELGMGVQSLLSPYIVPAF